MMRILAIASVACFGLVLAAGPVAAQDDKPSVKFSFFELTGNLVVGKSFKIDQAYGAEHSKEVKAPFRFIAPTSDELLAALQATPDSDSFVKIAYATLNKQFIENFQFSTLTVAMAAPEERLKAAARVLANQGFAMVVKPYEEAKRDGVRKIEIGPYAAVEVFGRYVDPAHGLMYTRLVGILNPNSEHSVFMVANIAAARLPLEHPDELATRTRSGAALTTFKYLE